MKNKVMFIFIIIIMCVLILSFNNNVEAILCRLYIEDSSESTGFIEKDGQLYYVVSIYEKTARRNSFKC